MIDSHMTNDTNRATTKNMFPRSPVDCGLNLAVRRNLLREGIKTIHILNRPCINCRG